MSLWKDFRAFAIKGNVVDLAVGVMVGSAFNKIVSSLVENLFMPVLGFLTAGVKVDSLALTLVEAHGSFPSVVVRYGAFLQSILDFLIIGFSVFLFVRFLRHLERQNPAPPPPREDLRLLTEIRDLLRQGH